MPVLKNSVENYSGTDLINRINHHDDFPHIKQESVTPSQYATYFTPSRREEGKVWAISTLTRWCFVWSSSDVVLLLHIVGILRQC